eukprot:415444-Amphidinium_carterae.1
MVLGLDCLQLAMLGRTERSRLAHVSELGEDHGCKGSLLIHADAKVDDHPLTLRGLSLGDNPNFRHL